MSDHDRVPEALPAALWRAIVEDAPIAISVLSPDGRMLIGNARYVELLGYTADDMRAMSVEDVTLPDDRPWTRSYLSRLVSGEIDHHTTDKVFVRKGGGHVRVRLSTTALRRDGECVAIVGVLVPDTDRQPLADSWFRKVIQNINDTVTLIDADGTVLDTSGRYKRVMGYPNEFWESRSLFDVMLPEEAGRVLQMREDILANPGELIHTTVRMRNADNGVEVLDVHAANLLDDPEIGGILLTTRNITAERELVEQLSRRRDEAVAEAELRSRVMATVSHELRNPLHGITGITELLAQRLDGTDEGAMAAALHAQSLTLQRIVNDLLDLSRVEQVGLQLRPVSFDLTALVRSVTAMATVGLQRDSVEVEVTIDPTTPTIVVGDRDHLGQVLHNVIGNAVKYTTAGHVRIAVASSPDGTTTFTVSDSGIGIDDDTKERIFEAFVRGDEAAVTHRGAGLGLAIVHVLVTNMDGTIEVASEVGRGSTFTITLPLPPGQAAPVPTSPPALEVPSTVLRVLVVDDDAVNQMVAEAQCARLGMTARSVNSGEQALELLRAERFDAMLLDVQLAGMSGLAVAGALRSSPDRPYIIGMTASASAADQEACFEAGMDHFVAKPADLRAISDALARAAARTTEPSGLRPSVAFPAS